MCALMFVRQYKLVDLGITDLIFGFGKKKLLFFKPPASLPDAIVFLIYWVVF